MPWIERKNNVITALYDVKQYAEQEFLDEDNQEVIDFKQQHEKQIIDEIEQKIRQRMRELAINSLKNDGGLPPDFGD